MLAAKTATLMILGNTCTRGCRFCSVKSGNPGGVIDEAEPFRVATEISTSSLAYAVITCVDRDDLADGGASIFAQTIRLIHRLERPVLVEALVSDYGGSIPSLGLILESRPEVFAHNIETVRRLSPSVRDVRASYDTSLDVLSTACLKGLITKSSLMLGLGETRDEILEAMSDLKNRGVDILTLGQYLQPLRRCLPVAKWWTPEEFSDLDLEARRIGFKAVACSPLVRSSYKAAELYRQIAS